MVVGYKNIVSQPNQKDNMNGNKEKIVCEIMDRESYNNEKVIKNEENHEVSSKEYLEEKGHNDLLRIPSNSNCWWSHVGDSEEKLDSRQRWSFGSDISIEAVENMQNRLCCSPVDEFDSTVSSESEDLIVNNTEDSESYKCVQVSPACSPTFKKEVMCAGNSKEQHKRPDVDTADDELIDYSKRYTTDSSLSMVENKSSTHIQQQQPRRNLVINAAAGCVPEKKQVNTRSKAYPYGVYAETDLDQPTDYSLRYAEEDTDEEEKEDSHFYCSAGQEDSIKTYYTEGTPSNFSTATSMSDLLTLEDPREGEEATSKCQYVRDQKQFVEPKEIEKSDKLAKDCKNRMRRKFVSEESRIPILEEPRDQCERKLDKLHTPPQSPAETCDKNKESKVVNFQAEDNYAQETPLMFSRSSSLDSLSEFDQNSIQDDHSSVISDFSHRTSGAVSPSELPDSPTQTVPPSPRRLERESFSNLQQQRLLQPQPQLRRVDRESLQDLQQPQRSQLLQTQLQPQARRIGRDNFHNLQHQPIPQLRAQPQIQMQPRPQFLPQVQLSAPRIPPRPLPRNPSHPQSEIRMNHCQMQMIERSQPDGCASLVQRQQVNTGGMTQRVQQHIQPNNHTEVSQQQNARVAERCFSVFEDGLVRFKEESMPGKHSSAASSLSALTIDDEEGETLDNREIVNRIAAIRVRSSATGMHQSPCAQRQARFEVDKTNGQSTVNALNEHSGYRSNVSYSAHRTKSDDEGSDYTTSYSSKDLQNNRYRDPVKNTSWYENELKIENCNQAKIEPSASNSISKRPDVNGEASHKPAQKTYPEETVPVDTLRVYNTEDTPIYVSPYGSQSNLSVLSMLSISDDDNHGYAQLGDPANYGEEEEEEVIERSNSRANSYDSEARSGLSDEDDGEEEEEEDGVKRYAGSGVMRRRIDVSPFESQMNLNFALLRIEEEDEEQEEDKVNVEEEKDNDETDGLQKVPVNPSYEEDDDDEDVYRRLSRRNSECSDDEEVLQQYIDSGMSKITRRSLESGSVL